MYVLYKTFSKSLCNRLSNYFYTERPSINVTACLTSKPLISRFSNKSIINFTAVRPFSVTS